MNIDIKVTRRTEYTTTVELDEAKFNQLRADLDSDDFNIRNKAESEINNMIKPADWSDDEILDVDTFERSTP